MNQVYLNGQFIEASQAKISPMDRGFLFGDGIYEVVPTYGGKTVGLSLHLQRLRDGLSAVGIDFRVDDTLWQDIITRLIKTIDSDAVGVYIHISRGADVKRFHAYPQNIRPTVFAYGFEIPASQSLDKTRAKKFRVTLQEDLRWKRCQIKSTSLLGNVMHFQQGQVAGVDETILYNQQGLITEASACNVFMVKDGVVKTPPLDNQLLPGITRAIIIEAIKNHTNLSFEECFFSKQALMMADEVWISSSSKEVGAVVEIDGNIVGDGKVGNIWLQAQTAYNQQKFIA